MGLAYTGRPSRAPQQNSSLNWVDRVSSPTRRNMAGTPTHEAKHMCAVRHESPTSFIRPCPHGISNSVLCARGGVLHSTEKAKYDRGRRLGIRTHKRGGHVDRDDGCIDRVGIEPVDAGPCSRPDAGAIFRFSFPLSEVTHRREGWMFSRAPTICNRFLTIRGSGSSLRVIRDVEGSSSLIGWVDLNGVPRLPTGR